MVRFLPDAPWQGLRPMGLARVALAEVAPAIASLCHWTPDSAETHEEFHFGNLCPYAVVAAVLRGEADPREGRPGSTLVGDLRAELATAQTLVAYLDVALGKCTDAEPQVCHNVAYVALERGDLAPWFTERWDNTPPPPPAPSTRQEI